MEWVIQNNMLVKEFILKDFNQALDFINRVGMLAEEMNHHPDILLHSYKKVKIILFTHSVGEITELDRKLASKIDQV